MSEKEELKRLVRLLEKRKGHYREKAKDLLLQQDYDRDEFNDAQFMYGRYIDVCADIYECIRHDTLTQTDQKKSVNPI